jgi:hypothetical protein
MIAKMNLNKLKKEQKAKNTFEEFSFDNFKLKDMD